MKNRFALPTTVISFLVLFIVAIALRPLWATSVSGEAPDIIIKINDLEKNFNILDDVFGSKVEHSGRSITELVRQQLLNAKLEGATHHLDLSSFQKGVYFITIRSKDFVTTKKIIKL